MFFLSIKFISLCCFHSSQCFFVFLVLPYLINLAEKTILQVFFILPMKAENRCGETSPGCECENGCEVPAAGNQFEFHTSGAALDART